MKEERRRFAVPVLLMAMPLLIIGVLAFQASEADRRLLLAEQAEATATRLHVIDNIATAAVERITMEAVASVSSALTSAPDAASALRNLVLTGVVEFVIVEDSGRRLFPTERSPEPLPIERHKLRILAGPLDSLRAGLDVRNGGKGKGWAWIADEKGRSLFHCRLHPPAHTLCVLLDGERIRQAVQAALDTGIGKSDLWAVTLFDAAGAPVWSQPHDPAEPKAGALRLAEPLEAWQAEARRRPAMSLGERRWPVLMAIIAPLTASWVTLGWIFNRAQRNQLEEGRRRAEIASQLSHDLRTPLANLRLYADLIARKADDPAATRDYCGIIEEEIGRLSILADNAVAIAKGGAADMVRYGTAVPAAMVRSIVARLSPLLESAGCTASVTARAASPIAFDLSAFERIVTNLLDNARKHAPGSAIDIETWIDGESLMVSVRDHGPGLPQGPIERLFVAHMRGSGNGFGLGLASVRRLARANGGDVRVDRASPGARVTAWIRSTPQAEDTACTS